MKGRKEMGNIVIKLTRELEEGQGKCILEFRYFQGEVGADLNVQ